MNATPEPLFGHHRIRSINAPLMEAMDPPVSSLHSTELSHSRTSSSITIESDEVAKLREDLNRANSLAEQLTSESRALQAQLDHERRNSIALSRTNKDLTFQSEDLAQELAQLRAETLTNGSGALKAQLDLERRNSVALSRTNKDLTFQSEDLTQQLAQLRNESAELNSGIERLQGELQQYKGACQQQEKGNIDKAREIERLGHKLIGKERDNARLHAELVEIRNRQDSADPSSVQNSSRRHSVDDRVHLIHTKSLAYQEELARTKLELEQLRVDHTELTKRLRAIPFLEQKMSDISAEFTQKVEELQGQITHWKNKFTTLSARNAELTGKLTEAGVKGYGMHHRRSSSLTR